MDFVLERLHIPERIVLENGKSYTCGRGKENTIICLGLQVSRQHCVFFHATDKLFVTDLKSSNGIFINGMLQEPYRMVQLHQDDIIGIGCADIEPDDTTLFAYKIYITRASDPTELMNTSDMSSTVPNCNTMICERQSNSDIQNGSRDKRGISPNCDMPCKVPRYTDNNEIVSNRFHGPSTSTDIPQNNNNEVNNVEVASDTSIHIKQENDIEIIHTTFPESKDWDIKDHILKYETYLNNVKLKNYQIDDKMDFSVDENHKNNSENNKAMDNKHREKTNSFDKTDDIDLKGAKFIYSNDQLIKLEDELQLTDEDEAAHVAVTNSKATCKTTPIKLKKIKHEPKTRFSEIDVVDLSDDEDGIFPYSQLFDIKYEDNVKQETEIKQECASSDVNKIDLMDIDDEVIVLTDSEDDDNPWLHRLSRNQLMNEDKKLDVIKSVIKDEIDLGIWQEDTSRLAQDAIPSTSKDFNQVAEEQSAGIDTFKDSACKETFLERTSIDKRTIHDDNNDTDLQVVKTGLMDVDDDGSSNKSNLKNTDDITRQENDVSQNVKSHNKHTEKTSPSANERYKSKHTIKRGIPLIEAPHLPSRRGRYKSSDRKKDSSKDYNKAAKISEDISLSSSTTEENKMQKLKDKLENYNTEQSKEVSKDSSDHTVSSKQNRTSISKEEKKIIIEERKAKLKKIAEEEKLAVDNNKNVKRGTAKPRVKVSHKNRGDFLCNEQEARVSKPPSNKSKSERTKSGNNKANHTTSTCEDGVPESVIHDIEMRRSRKENISRNKISNIATSSEESSLNNILDRIKLSEKHNDVNNYNMNNNIVKRCDIRRKHKSTASTTNSSERTAFVSTEISSECASVCNKENKISSKSVETNKKKKGVTFSVNVDVREFTTESENEPKRLTGKNTPFPPDKLSPKLEMFLFRIFSWNPVWLEEQRYLKIEPPIVPEEELQNMKLHYESYMDYYRVALPLLLLETWHSISKDFEDVAYNAKHKTAMCSIVGNSIASTPIPTTECCLTTLMLEVLVTREDLNKQSHPNFGDLVSFEYVQYAKGKQSFRKVFAYVTSMSQAVISDFTHYNRDLRNYVPNAYAVITYSVQTRAIEHEILLNRIHRVRTITYLRANMRTVQALQYLPKSPLLDLILNPNVANYQLPPFNTSFIYTSLVTGQKLNPKQLEAVSRVTDVVTKNEAKLCFIQGPPGTGKSRVIVNLVAQILYGERENKNDKIKILLCAPSNAAIDEVVMRLFAIRPNLKEKYNCTFNLVRIGRLENMHPSVKVVSPSELARRHLRKFTENVVTWSVNSMTNYATEKGRLQVLIDEYQAELNAANLTEARLKTIKRKLTDASVKYELLMSKQLFDDVNPKDRARCQRLTEEYILARADIIACTLSSCYTNQMESVFGANKEKLSVCIVDEATQSCEAETLIPLMLGVNTMVLVGDPNQLPATILSQRAKKLGLDQSIFSRMQHVFMSETSNPIIMLDIQYRMTYSISYWPNKYFYDNKLKNAIECRLTFPFQPYRVLCHSSIQNNDKFSNTTEAEFVANMIHAMFIYPKWEHINDPITIGVLTPYNNQRAVILNKINEKISTLPENMKKRITYEVNTVDSFQGQERDVIIMSCVRSHGIGFLSDKQRLCVALTRAKHSLILCGNFNTFMKDQMWKSLLSDARSRGVLYDVDANATTGVIKQFVIK